jgi:hypothetical protein
MDNKVVTILAAIAFFAPLSARATEKMCESIQPLIQMAPSGFRSIEKVGAVGDKRAATLMLPAANECYVTGQKIYSCRWTGVSDPGAMSAEIGRQIADCLPGSKLTSMASLGMHIVTADTAKVTVIGAFSDKLTLLNIAGVTTTQPIAVDATKAAPEQKADTPQTGRLHAAVKANDSTALQRALVAAIDLNERDNSEDQATALFLAARAGQIDMVRMLLDKGAKLEIGGSYGRTPLLPAAENGHLDVIRLLLSRGADIECSAHEFGWTCLKVAAYAKQLPAVKLLLEKGAKLDARGEIGDDNALAVAALKSGNAAVVRYLLEQGIDFQTPAKNGATPLERAQASKDPEIVALIEDRIRGTTAAKKAAQSAPQDLAYSCDVLAASIELVVGTLEQVRDGKVFSCKLLESIGTSLTTTRRYVADAAKNSRCDLTKEDADGYLDSAFDATLAKGLADCTK